MFTPLDEEVTSSPAANLSSIADTVRKQMENPEFMKADDPEPIEEGYSGPGAVVIGTPPPPKAPTVHSEPVSKKGPTPVPVATDANLNLSPGPMIGPQSPIKTNTQFVIEGVTEVALRQVMPDVSEEEFAQYVVTARDKYAKYRKDMIIQGLSPTEAIEATKANLMRDAQAFNAEHNAPKPGENVDIVINKQQESAAIDQFTPEEKDKMIKAKTIRLVVIEDKSLANVAVDKIDIKHQAEFLHTISGGLAKYSVPLPATGDYCTFRGAQLIKLMTVIANDDEQPAEALARKSQFIYDQFVGGTILKKGEYVNYARMSYETFCNSVAFSDVDMCLFGALCAGQQEVAEAGFNCTRCNTEFKFKYNTKTLLSMDGFSDFFKERTDFILGNRTNANALAETNKLMHEAQRYKSPFTRNMYDVEVPSIAKAQKILDLIDPKDRIKSYHALIAIYLHAIYIYNTDTGRYSEIDSEDELLPTLMEIVGTLPDDDIKMLSKEISEKFQYNPVFKMNLVCPNCGAKSTLNMSINQLVFRKAQDMSMEMML